MEAIDTQAIYTAIQWAALLIGPIVFTLGVLIYQHHKQEQEFHRIQSAILSQRRQDDLNACYSAYLAKGNKAWGNS